MVAGLGCDGGCCEDEDDDGGGGCRDEVLPHGVFGVTKRTKEVEWNIYILEQLTVKRR